MFSVFLCTAGRDVPGTELSQSDREELFADNGYQRISLRLCVARRCHVRAPSVTSKLQQNTRNGECSFQQTSVRYCVPGVKRRQDRRAGRQAGENYVPCIPTLTASARSWRISA